MFLYSTVSIMYFTITTPAGCGRQESANLSFFFMRHWSGHVKFNITKLIRTHYYGVKTSCRGGIRFPLAGNFMQTYDRRIRTQPISYPDMDSFIPHIAKVLNNLSPDELSKDFLSKAIKITNSSLPNEDKNVDPATEKLIISFDRAMWTGKNSFGIRPGKYDKKSLPKITRTSWSPDAKQLIMDICLKPGKTYSLLFPEYFFMGIDYEPIASSLHLEFKTSN